MGRVTFKGRYDNALLFLVRNTDTTWLDDDYEPSLTIEAALVADIFEVNSSQVVADLRRLTRRAP